MFLTLACRHKVDAENHCRPPFGVIPDCFSVLGDFMVTSPSCAVAYARMWNISNPNPLVEVAATVNSIQDGCAMINTEVRTRGMRRNISLVRDIICTALVAIFSVLLSDKLLYGAMMMVIRSVPVAFVHIPESSLQFRG